MVKLKSRKYVAVLGAGILGSCLALLLARKGITVDLFDLESAPEDIIAAGGYVFAQGCGSLASASSTLHRRDCFGVVRRGHYYSIDTGKYSIAPWLAEAVA